MRSCAAALMRFLLSSAEEGGRVRAPGGGVWEKEARKKIKQGGAPNRTPPQIPPLPLSSSSAKIVWSKPHFSHVHQVHFSHMFFSYT